MSRNHQTIEEFRYDKSNSVENETSNEEFDDKIKSRIQKLTEMPSSNSTESKNSRPNSSRNSNTHHRRMASLGSRQASNLGGVARSRSRSPID